MHRRVKMYVYAWHMGLWQIMAVRSCTPSRLTYTWNVYFHLRVHTVDAGVYVCIHYCCLLSTIFGSATEFPMIRNQSQVLIRQNFISVVLVKVKWRWKCNYGWVRIRTNVHYRNKVLLWLYSWLKVNVNGNNNSCTVKCVCFPGIPILVGTLIRDQKK